MKRRRIDDPATLRATAAIFRKALARVAVEHKTTVDEPSKKKDAA